MNAAAEERIAEVLADHGTPTYPFPPNPAHPEANVWTCGCGHILLNGEPRFALLPGMSLVASAHLAHVAEMCRPILADVWDDAREWSAGVADACDGESAHHAAGCIIDPAYDNECPYRSDLS